MPNPYQAPDADPELEGDVPTPEWLESFRDPARQVNWLTLTCSLQFGIAAAMYFGGWRSLELYFVCDALLWLSLPLMLLALLPFARVTTANARLFLAEPLEARGSWPWWLLLPGIGAVFAYSHVRAVAKVSGAPMAQHLAVPWLMGLTLFWLTAALPFGGGGYFFLGLGQLCLMVAARQLRYGQLRLLRLASVAQALLDAERKDP